MPSNYVQSVNGESMVSVEWEPSLGRVDVVAGIGSGYVTSGFTVSLGYDELTKLSADLLKARDAVFDTDFAFKVTTYTKPGPYYGTPGYDVGGTRLPVALIDSMTDAGIIFQMTQDINRLVDTDATPTRIRKVTKLYSEILALRRN